jgi:hypothetical protein
MGRARGANYRAPECSYFPDFDGVPCANSVQYFVEVVTDQGLHGFIGFPSGPMSGITGLIGVTTEGVPRGLGRHLGSGRTGNACTDGYIETAISIANRNMNERLVDFI